MASEPIRGQSVPIAGEQAVGVRVSVVEIATNPIDEDGFYTWGCPRCGDIEEEDGVLCPDCCDEEGIV